MVGKYALRWMGVPAYTGYIVDILVRTTQLISIHKAFIQTGEWREVDESTMDELHLEFHAVEHRSVRKLKRSDDDRFLRLCDEDSCSLGVLVESEFHPDSLDRSVRPYQITDDNIKFAGDGRSSDDGSCALRQINMDNGARYLVLDSLGQQDILLAKVTNSERLTQYFEKRWKNQERGMKGVMKR
ncbi:hypothetical protein HOY82DRAFT_597516 [Tuber indicum]|nr:hypothetical protein HOY82DRAFT_597516 [Tuber indicum]